MFRSTSLPISLNYLRGMTMETAYRALQVTHPGLLELVERPLVGANTPETR